MTVDHLEYKEAVEELESLVDAQQSMLNFCRKIEYERPPALHHIKLIGKLQQIIDGKLQRLMVLMPPGSAKSTYCSILLPACYLGMHPTRRVICASYDEGLPTQFGRKVRNLVETPEYYRIFPREVAQDTRAKAEWELVDGGSYYGTGVGTAVAGRRAHLAILDDLIKGREAADSPTIRNKTWDWYISDLRPRLIPRRSAICFITTRWHQDDVAGRILPEDWSGESGLIEARDGEIWDVLCIPAEAVEGDPLGRKPGEWLWLKWFSEKIWRQERVTQGGPSGRNWSAMYQQNPSPEEGTYFKREWFKRFDPRDLPSVRKYQTADFAVTDEAEADDPDYTEIGIHGLRNEWLKGDNSDIQVTKLYLCIDGWSGRKNPLDWVHEYFNLQKRHKPDCEFAEVGVIRRATEGILQRERANRRAWGRIEWMPHIGNKEANARALQSMAQMGFVSIANTEYGDYCLSQLVDFPTAKHDDVVDELALMARAVDEAWPMLPPPPAPPENKKRDRWDRAFERLDDGEHNWKTA